MRTNDRNRQLLWRAWLGVEPTPVSRPVVAGIKATRDDKAVEVHNAEVKLEDLLAGDEEPSDGISLGSQDTSSDNEDEEDKSFSSGGSSSEALENNASEPEASGSSAAPEKKRRTKKIKHRNPDTKAGHLVHCERAVHRKTDVYNKSQLAGDPLVKKPHQQPGRVICDWPCK